MQRLKKLDMKPILIIAITLIVINCKVQDIIIYPKGEGNVAEMLYIGEDSIPYIKNNDIVKAKYLSLAGLWEAKEDSTFKFNLQFFEQQLYIGEYCDRCVANNIKHADFDGKYELYLTITDANNLNEIYFSTISRRYIRGIFTSQ